MDDTDRVRISQQLADLEWNVRRLLGREEMTWETRPASAAVAPDVLEALESGNVIEAIKRHRTNTGLGLAEAKAVVEGLQGGT